MKIAGRLTVLLYVDGFLPIHGEAYLC